ncbi:PTS sugar transporter subunit IIA [Elongatibacter sediminis]|uniref:PTS EIIA type-4 domain-containing protein n=1 Tax=Elongatibacter sediminis TaxID=3119006 RepID=A0AAW9RL37_9GAMM
MNAMAAKTGLVVITHGQIGHALIEAAEFILDQPLGEIGCLSFRQTDGGCTSETEILAAIDAADQGSGVLVLADIGGASPCNAVNRLLPDDRTALVTGVNLAMLIRAWNYRSRPPAQLARMAALGAVRDITSQEP